jgi:hypothetical protein
MAPLTGFPTRKAAELKARELDLDRRRGDFVDPDAGSLTLTARADTWFDSLDIGPATLDQYRSLTRCHIQPRWGPSTPRSRTVDRSERFATSSAVGRGVIVGRRAAVSLKRHVHSIDAGHTRGGERRRARGVGG